MYYKVYCVIQSLGVLCVISARSLKLYDPIAIGATYARRPGHKKKALADTQLFLRSFYFPSPVHVGEKREAKLRV